MTRNAIVDYPKCKSEFKVFCYGIPSPALESGDRSVSRSAATRVRYFVCSRDVRGDMGRVILCLGLGVQMCGLAVG